MYHPIDSNFLYCALKIHVTFCDENGKEILAKGTGFAVSVNGRAVLVTNRHVLDSGFVDSRKKNWSIRQIVVTGYGNSGSYFELLLSEWIIEYSNNPLEDVAAVTIDSFFPNIDMADFAGVVNFATEFLADDEFYTGLNVGDFVVFSGYPEFHDHKSNRPLIRSGVISSDPRYNFASPKMNEGLRTLAYEGFSTPGASGGPVFSLPVGMQLTGNYRPPKIIGINAGHLKVTGSGEHSGISYLYKSMAITELLQKIV